MNVMKDMLNIVRYSAAAPFSRVYAAKRRWLRESGEWEAQGIAQGEMRRKVYVVPRTEAVCITVSKCANTSLKYMLYPEGKEVTRDVHSDDHMLTRLIDAGLTLNDLLDGSHRVFTFVRHPVARFWSCYLTRILNGRETSEILREIAGYAGVPARSGFPPELVLDYIKDTSPVVMDEHIRPLWSCTGIERLPIDFIGRVESMEGDVRTLLEMGFLDDGHVRRLKHLNRSAGTEFPDKARIDRIIRDVYARDMELFGYE
jgi:hypothetical protein